MQMVMAQKSYADGDVTKDMQMVISQKSYADGDVTEELCRS